MIKKLIFLTFFVVLLSACVEKPLCTQPYFEYKQGECCLDENNNKICDRDEQKEEAPAQPLLPEEKTEQITLPEKTETSVEQTEEEQTTTEDPLIIGREKILNTLVTKVKSVQYTYEGHTFFVKPPNVGIVLDTIKPAGVDEEDNSLYIDTVYLDMVTKDAFAGCEAQENTNEKKCGPLWRELIEVNYESYAKPTPFDWIVMLQEGEMLDYRKKYSSLEQRFVDYVTFAYDNQVIELWVDSEFGVPLKARESKNLRIHSYQQLTINSVTEADVFPTLRTQGVQVIG